MADFTQLETRDAANQGTWITIPDPRTGIPTKKRLLILGKDSDAFRIKETEQRERIIAAANVTGSFRLPPDAVQENAIELLVACTIDWDGFVEDEKAPIPVAAPFSKDEVTRLYKTSPFTREFVDKAVADRTLFAGR